MREENIHVYDEMNIVVEWTEKRKKIIPRIRRGKWNDREEYFYFIFVISFVGELNERETFNSCLSLNKR